MGWINVNDRLPESAEQVLCVKEYKNGIRQMCFGSYCFKRWSTGSGTGRGKVTYWMPLPKMPEEECKE